MAGLGHKHIQNVLARQVIGMNGFSKVAVSCSLSLFFCSSVNAASIDIPSSFNPVGSGARALGLGGSFIAVADDATAASWNPAGLIQLRKPEVALVLSQTVRGEDVTLANTGDGADTSTSNFDVNYAAASYPCAESKCGKNMVFSVNYQRLYDLSREWNISVYDDFRNTVSQERYNQDGALYALGLSYAVQLTADFTIGMSANYWGDVFGTNGSEVVTSARERENAPGDFFADEDILVSSDFEGLNYNIGALWVPYRKGASKLTIGVVYKSEFDADYNSKLDYQVTSGNLSIPSTIATTTDISESPSTITMPSSYGLGIAYQVSDAFTFSFDLYRTDWKAFKVKDKSTGSVISAITNRPIDETSIENSFQVRAGAEYRIISQKQTTNYIIPIRAGFFYDPVIGDGGNEPSYGIAIGGGVAFERWVFDAAYQYRWADNLGESYQQQLGLSYSLQEHQLYASAFYRF
ncbi:MAG: hypothetical protein CL582_10600 [Alteromonadaceae bacterium]|jgi:long-subunit fatty acid transport protein|nr:hypothetical protein [Alteromonadaceae bacterium]|tara:strand:+ start:218 stop:1612 length:1395 start_codon:yes stop_codon:yes gene_type:complete